MDRSGALPGDPIDQHPSAHHILQRKRSFVSRGKEEDISTQLQGPRRRCRPIQKASNQDVFRINHRVKGLCTVGRRQNQSLAPHHLRCIFGRRIPEIKPLNFSTSPFSSKQRGPRGKGFEETRGFFNRGDRNNLDGSVGQGMHDDGRCPEDIDHDDRFVGENLGIRRERHELNVNVHVAKVPYLLR